MSVLTPAPPGETRLQRLSFTAPVLWIIPLAVLCGAGIWFGITKAKKAVSSGSKDVPTVKVARGNVSLSIFSKGEIRGGNSESLAAPMTGGTELHITMLRKPGEAVKPGDPVIQFDTTDQEYALREGESDMAEADAHVKQASAQAQADAEEDRYALRKGEADIRTAELEKARKNPLLPPFTAKQNDLAVAVAPGQAGATATEFSEPQSYRRGRDLRSSRRREVKRRVKYKPPGRILLR